MAPSADLPAVLVAAFEPFGGRRRNRSLDAAARLAGEAPAATLPVDFARLPAAVAPLVDGCTRALILVGESAAARCPQLEQFALNHVDARVADNADSMPHGVEVIAGGPVAYRATWPARALAERARVEGFAVELSAHAGAFACNAALYLALHHAAGRPGAPSIGFVHVPARWPFASDGRSAQLLRWLVAAVA
jgi:pyroglutamyl-peptidase